MSQLLLSLKNIHLTFGGTPLLEGADLAVTAGARICLVGRNGSGKSTLLRIAAGAVEPDDGDVFRHPEAHITYLAQEVDFKDAPTTLSFVAAGLPDGENQHRAHQFLEKLQLTGAEPTAHLSGGEARRAAIARALVSDPDILLLDEPTNHLDLPCIEWLEAELSNSRAAIVLVSHDRRLLANLSNETIWLDRGKTRSHPQGFAKFEAWRDDLLEQEELERHKQDRKIAREEAWMYAGGVTARRKRNMRRVAELENLRRQRREARKSIGNVSMTASAAGASGRRVIHAHHLTKSYDGLAIVKDFSIRIDRGDRVGIVGPNGTGKTTLLKMLVGELAPDAGTVEHGTNLHIITLDQSREILDPKQNVAETITRGHGDWIEINGRRRHVASYMKDFLFSPEQARSAVKVLSGGERARLLLARALATPSNVMVLDEPTNDLDLETLDLLQELIADYAGTLILISHDRDFLDRIVTTTVAFEGNGRWIEYAGGYTDMLAQRPSNPDPTENQTKLQKSSERVTKTRARVQPADKPKRKLSFKEKHAHETLPKTIDDLSHQVENLRAKVAAPDFYAKDPTAFAATTEALHKAQSELQAAEDQWLELEILRQDLEGPDTN